MTEATTATPDAACQIVLERVIDAPRALVWKALTDPAHLPTWFGPKGYSCETHAIDVREGGGWHFTMHGPEGVTFGNHHAYESLVAPSRLVYTVGTEPGGEPEFRAVITLEDLGVRTRLVQSMTMRSPEEVARVKGFGAVELGYTTLDKLAARVATMGLRLSRTLDAPRELVYQVWSDPKHLAKWWGPKGMELEVLSLDFQPGGVFHYRMFNAQGAEMWGRFQYLETVAPERIAYISGFSDPSGALARAPFPGLEAFPLEVYNLLTLTEAGEGKTQLEMGGGPLGSTREEAAVYEGMFPSMQQGFGGTFDQLSAYLAELQAA